MVLFQVTLGQGRTPEQVNDLIQVLTRAAASNLGVAPEDARVIIYEIPLTHSAKGGVTIKEMREARAKAQGQAQG